SGEEPISIDVDYSELDLQGKDENNLYLYWYDPETQDWYALPSLVDPATKTLHATTTHFTVFDTGINDFTASHLPTVDAFQVSTYTGAATYSMPIEVPPGPGGLQPNINLSYNSQVIDQSTAQTQASWVGMGWSLGMNSIELDDHGTNELNTNNSSWSQDDTWSINVNGISSTIVRVGSGYRAADENFMKFVYNPTDDTWTVWDKQGNVYYFEQKVQTMYQQAGESDDCQYRLVTYQWFLKRMVNIFGKQLTYTYANETKTVNAFRWHGNSTQRCEADLPQTLVTATYPDT